MLVAFPLLIIPFAIYNMIAFLTPPDKGWATPIVTVPLVSGEVWTITFGNALIVLALLMLLFEVVKAARPGTKSVIDHFLSTLVFAGAVAEFVMVKEAANSTFALLCAICLVDVLGGIAISIRVRRSLRAVAVVSHVAAPHHEPDYRAPPPPRVEPEVLRPSPPTAHHDPDILPPDPSRPT